jgi:hypothetical protein
MTDLVQYHPSELTERRDLLPYVPPEREHTDGWIAVIEPVTKLAEAVAATDFVPRGLQGNAPAVAAAILYGRELNMPPMQSLSQIHMIEGRPSVSAEQLRAMVLAAGHEIAYTELTGGSVTVQGKRKGSTLPPTTITWTLPMAQAAQLTGKKNWQRHPRQMLEARATAELCRLIFADVIHGVRVAEEEQDDADGTAGGAPESGRSRVSRAKKGAESVTAAGDPAADAPPSSTAPASPVATRTPRPPLPGTKAKATPAPQTPGEGQSTSSTGAGVAPLTPERVAEIHGVPAEMVAPPQCPHISNGEQCTWPAGHPSRRHSFDPPDQPLSEGDGSAEDVAATASDEEYAARQAEQQAEGAIPDADVVEDRERHCSDWETAHPRHTWSDADGAWGCPGTSAASAGGPVEDKPEELHPGQRRALFAAFKSLGVLDDAERHHASSALLGRKVTSWTELTDLDGSKMLTALARVNTREELEELIQEAAEKWGEGGA